MWQVTSNRPVSKVAYGYSEDDPVLVREGQPLSCPQEGMLSNILLSPFFSLFFCKVSLEEMVKNFSSSIKNLLDLKLLVASKSLFCTQDIIVPVNPQEQWLELIYISIFTKKWVPKFTLYFLCFLLLHYDINYWRRLCLSSNFSFCCILHNILLIEIVKYGKS